MTDFDNTNTGALFKTKKKKNEKSPDYYGRLNVAGKEYRLGAWLKDTKVGKILSIRVSTPEEQKQEQDDIPF